MRSAFRKISACICAAAMLTVSGCAGKGRTIVESLKDRNEIASVSEHVYKTETNANPVSPSIFCADPTAVEYDGRLYVYATNDTQQAENSDKNDYVHIKSFVVFSTDDMVNWAYHGRIEVGEIAPWIQNSWAPSIVSRKEKDGKTHFYLYFSNNGNGVGVLTAEHPLGPWSDPLGKPLIWQAMPGLENCPAPFDPGVCIDENGVGWLTFGGGVPANGGKVHTKVPKIVQLGEDMLSFDSDFVSIDAPYFFEASELNYIDGTYYYTYSTDWQKRGAGWDYDNAAAPPVCSMAYLTTKTPLDSASWEFRGGYFYNSGENADGESGLRWGNNHTHFCEYQGTNYILHHTLLLEELMGGTAGFRSLMVDYLPMYSATEEIPITAASRKGVAQIKPLDPYAENIGTVMQTSADIGYTNETEIAAKSDAAGAWICVKGADFGYGASDFTAEVKGHGTIEVRLDDLQSEAVAFISFDCDEYTWVRSNEFSDFSGRNHNIYLVFPDADVELRAWQFGKAEETQRPEETLESAVEALATLVISGQAENPGPSHSAIAELTGNGEYAVKSSSFAPESHVLNLGFVNQDADADYQIYASSVGLETENGIVEIPVGAELSPSGKGNNGLANGWNGAEIGAVIYGTEDTGIIAAETDIDWIGYRLALIVDGKEVPYISVTYNLTISGLPE